MPLADYEDLISERFDIEVQDLRTSFGKNLSQISATFTKAGHSFSSVHLRASIDAHCKELKTRTEKFCKCVLKVLDAAREPISKDNLDQVITYINKAIDAQAHELSAGVASFKNQLQNNPQGAAIFVKELNEAASLEKRRVKNDFQTMLLSNEKASEKLGTTAVTNNITNYGHIVGLQTGAGSTLNQNISVNDASQIIESLVKLRAFLESGKEVILTPESKTEIIEATETIEQEVHATKKNKHAIIGALSVLGGWAEKIEAVRKCYEHITPMLVDAAGPHSSLF